MGKRSSIKTHPSSFNNDIFRFSVTIFQYCVAIFIQGLTRLIHRIKDVT
jgi:hypothetical protein